MSEKPPALRYRVEEPRQVRSLQITQPAVDNPQAVEAGLGAKIVALQQQASQASANGLQGNARTVNAAADNGNVKAAAGKSAGVALDDGHSE